MIDKRVEQLELGYAASSRDASRSVSAGFTVKAHSHNARQRASTHVNAMRMGLKSVQFASSSRVQDHKRKDLVDCTAGSTPHQDE